MRRAAIAGGCLVALAGCGSATTAHKREPTIHELVLLSQKHEEAVRREAHSGAEAIYLSRQPPEGVSEEEWATDLKRLRRYNREIMGPPK